MSTVGLLHYTCPPIVGGVESLIALHCRLLVSHGYRARVLAGRGSPFNPQVALTLIDALDSKYPPLLAVNEELKAGQVGAGFHKLADELADRLVKALGGLDVCIIHNALTLHFNLPLTAAPPQPPSQRALKGRGRITPIPSGKGGGGLGRGRPQTSPWSRPAWIRPPR